MQKIKEQAQSIIDKYNLQLAPLGIKILLSKKYFETSVGEPDTYHPESGARLLNYIASYFDKKKERKFKRIRNRYYCLILSVLPIDKTIIPREYCKEYAIVLRKVERSHIGETPQHVDYAENKVLKKIKKKLEKVLKKAKRLNKKKVCKDTVWDAFRYCILPEYNYKSKILNKDKFYWDIIFIFVASLLAIVASFIIGYIL